MRKAKRTRNDKRKRKLELRQIADKTESQTVTELIAAKQGKAIAKHNQLAIHAPRLNFIYMLDGFAVPSGKKHRKIG